MEKNFIEPNVTSARQTFKRNLGEIDESIEDRNKVILQPYKSLLPGQIPNTLKAWMSRDYNFPETLSSDSSPSIGNGLVHALTALSLVLNQDCLKNHSLLWAPVRTKSVAAPFVRSALCNTQCNCLDFLLCLREVSQRPMFWVWSGYIAKLIKVENNLMRQHWASNLWQHPCPSSLHIDAGVSTECTKVWLPLVWLYTPNIKGKAGKGFSMFP